MALHPFYDILHGSRQKVLSKVLCLQILTADLQKQQIQRMAAAPGPLIAAALSQIQKLEKQELGTFFRGDSAVLRKKNLLGREGICEGKAPGLLIDSGRMRQIFDRIRRSARQCKMHPAVGEISMGGLITIMGAAGKQDEEFSRAHIAGPVVLADVQCSFVYLKQFLCHQARLTLTQIPLLLPPW